MIVDCGLDMRNGRVDYDVSPDSIVLMQFCAVDTTVESEIFVTIKNFLQCFLCIRMAHSQQKCKILYHFKPNNYGKA